MSTSVWPPISDELRVREEEASLARELQWLLDALQETLASLKSGLEGCAALLSPDKGASTLVLSTPRSESVKGFVTRIGTRVVKGDVNLKLASLRPPPGQAAHRLSLSAAPQAPVLALQQLTDVRNLINASLDVIDVTAWTGDAKNANFIAGQLRLLFDNVQEAKQSLKGDNSTHKQWWEDALDPETFDPPCPPNVSFHLDIADAALVLHVRTLEPAEGPENADSFTGFSLRDRFAAALGGPRVMEHDEMGARFTYNGHQVRVKEKVRVESQDPTLLSAMAKLSALEHSVAMSRRALDTVMGREE